MIIIPLTRLKTSIHNDNGKYNKVLKVTTSKKSILFYFTQDDCIENHVWTVWQDNNCSLIKTCIIA